MVSWTVAMALSLPPAADSGIEVEEGAWPEGGEGGVDAERRIRALEVFFWRSEYVCDGVLRRAAVGEEVRVSLRRVRGGAEDGV